VVVAAATGPVGSAVGQIARIKGARAIGIAGGPEKVRALVDDFGFDVGLDHRSPTFTDELRAATEDGIDVYFENVGGMVAAEVTKRLNKFARIPVCGLVANYNLHEAPLGPDQLPGFMGQILTKSLTVRGFIQDEFVPTHHEAFVRDMTRWVASGAVGYREDIVEGLDNTPDAFRGLLTGRNFGKLIVQVGSVSQPARVEGQR
jgi:NADPH-dependent curcumin reductase CurA